MWFDFEVIKNLKSLKFWWNSGQKSDLNSKNFVQKCKSFIFEFAQQSRIREIMGLPCICGRIFFSAKLAKIQGTLRIFSKVIFRHFENVLFAVNDCHTHKPQIYDLKYAWKMENDRKNYAGKFMPRSIFSK